MAERQLGTAPSDPTDTATKGYVDATVTAALAGVEPADSDLATIAALTATTNNVIQSVGGAWASRTPAQLKATLALGTAADTAATDYATAAQGAKADTAVQPAGLTGYAPLASPTFTGTPTLPTPVINGTPTGTGVAAAATASALALRDSNGNLLADVFIPTKAPTATAGATTTLTVADAQVQEFTGSLAQTVKLPTTGVTAGMAWVIINNSSGGAVTVQSSGANTILSMGLSKVAVFTARIDTPTAAADWTITGLGGSSSTVGNSTALRDGSGNLFALNFIPNVTPTATAAGTTALTVASAQTQVFTGSTTQTVTLPTTSITAGMEYRIINQSTGAVTVQSSGGNTVATVAAASAAAPTSTAFVALVSTPTTAAHWKAI
jgi:hypothetical protein